MPFKVSQKPKIEWNGVNVNNLYTLCMIGKYITIIGSKYKSHILLSN